MKDAGAAFQGLSFGFDESWHCLSERVKKRLIRFPLRAWLILASTWSSLTQGQFVV